MQSRYDYYYTMTGILQSFNVVTANVSHVAIVLITMITFHPYNGRQNLPGSHSDVKLLGPQPPPFPPNKVENLIKI